MKDYVKELVSLHDNMKNEILDNILSIVYPKLENEDDYISFSEEIIAEAGFAEGYMIEEIHNEHGCVSVTIDGVEWNIDKVSVLDLAKMLNALNEGKYHIHEANSEEEFSIDDFLNWMEEIVK